MCTLERDFAADEDRDYWGSMAFRGLDYRNREIWVRFRGYTNESDPGSLFSDEDCWNRNLYAVQFFLDTAPTLEHFQKTKAYFVANDLVAPIDDEDDDAMIIEGDAPFLDQVPEDSRGSGNHQRAAKKRGSDEAANDQKEVIDKRPRWPDFGGF